MKNSCGIVTLIAKSKGIQRISSTKLFVVAGTVRAADVKHIGIVAPLERQTAC